MWTYGIKLVVDFLPSRFIWRLLLSSCLISSHLWTSSIKLKPPQLFIIISICDVLSNLKVQLYATILIIFKYTLQLQGLMCDLGKMFQLSPPGVSTPHHTRAPSGERWNCGRKMSRNFA